MIAVRRVPLIVVVLLLLLCDVKRLAFSVVATTSHVVRGKPRTPQLISYNFLITYPLYIHIKYYCSGFCFDTVAELAFISHKIEYIPHRRRYNPI